MVLAFFRIPRSSIAFFMTRPTSSTWWKQQRNGYLYPYRIPPTTTRYFSSPQTPDSLESISDSWSDNNVAYDDDDDDWNENDDEYRQSILRQGENRTEYKWFQNMTQLPFACTGCGKCCKTQGNVYMAPEEHEEASELLGISKVEFIRHYASHVIVSEEEENENEDDDAPILWLRLLDQSTMIGREGNNGDTENSASSSNRNNQQHGCIFLQDDNTCRIYEARPSQCSTYPFWPDILVSREAWNKEVRQPDDDDDDLDNDGDNHHNPYHNKEAPLWTVENGGCEGMRMIPEKSTHDNNEDFDDEFSVVGGIPREQVYIQSHVYEYDENRIPRSKEIPVQQYFKQ